jgi:hypothetical protein
LTLEQLSNLSQAVAAVAVIVSLVFVGIQLRQSTEQQQLFHIISHPRFHALYRAMVGAVDPASITEADRAWVGHINAGLKQYKANTSGNPYFLAISGRG